MASETEIERLMVRLVGDGSDYAAVLDAAIKDTMAATLKINQMASEEEAQQRLLEASIQATAAADRELIAAQDALAQAFAEGAAITRSVETDIERYTREVGELAEHLAIGTITQETFDRAVQASGNRLNQVDNSVQELAGNLTQLGFTVTVVGGFFSALFGSIAYGGTMAAGKFEQTTIAFETMLGSAKETTELLTNLTTFAAQTPFEMPEIESAARGLVQFGERGDELMATLEMLGNAASGTSTDFGMIALIFNQVRGVGHLLTQDFRQLSTRGVLSLQDIADHFHITTQAAQEMLSSGEISFEEFKKILAGLSAEGGRFENLMLKQSKSLLGMISTLKDNVNLLVRAIGEQLLPIAISLVGGLNSVVNTIRSLSPEVMGIVAAFIGFGAALGVVVTTAGSAILTAGQMATAYAALAAAATTSATANYVLATSIAAVETALTLGLYAAIAAVVAAVAVGVGWLVAWTAGQTGLEAGLEGITEGTKAAKTATDEYVASLIAQSQAQGSLGGGVLTIGTKKLEGEAADLRSRIKGLGMEAEQADGWWSALRRTFGATTEFDVAQQKQSALLEQLQNNVNGQKALADAKAKANEVPVATAEDVEKAKELADTLELTRNTFHMTEQEKRLYVLQTQHIDAATIEEISTLQNEIAEMEKTKKATEDAAKAKKELENNVKSFTSSLENQILALQLEASGAENVNDIIKYRELITAGATEQELARARALMEQKNQMEAAIKAEKEHQKVMGEGKRYMEQFMTPLEKYQKSMEDINRLLNAHAIDGKTASRATASAEEEFRKAAMEAENLTNKMAELKAQFMDNTAVRRGSKELRELMGQMAIDNLMADQQSKVDEQVAKVTNPPDSGPAAISFQAPVVSSWKPEDYGLAPTAPVRPSNPMNNDVNLDFLSKLLERIATSTEETAERDPIEVELANIFG